MSQGQKETKGQHDSSWGRGRGGHAKAEVCPVCVGAVYKERGGWWAPCEDSGSRPGLSPRDGR